MSQPLQQVINLPIKSQKVSKEIEEIKPKKKKKKDKEINNEK